MFSSLHRRLNKKDSSSETTDPNLISIGDGDGDGGDNHSITITNARHENGYECGYEYEHGSKRSSVSRGEKPTRQKKKNDTFTYTILVLLIIIIIGHTLPIFIVNFRIEAPNEQQQLQLMFTQNEGNGTAKSDQQKVIVQQRYNETATSDEQQQVIVQNKYNGTANEHDDQQQQLILQNNKDNQINCDGCNAEGKGAQTEGKETAEAEAAVAPEVCGKVAGDQYIIPRRLIFTYKENMLETKEPSYLYNNVQNTIQMYSKLWNQSVSEVDVWFLDDNECLKVIEQVEPRLIQPFQSENIGPYKADICRIAALYLCGGYYFDVDIQALEPLSPEPHIDFITAKIHRMNGFFQAVLATPPSHPILNVTYDSMINDWYFNPTMLKLYKLTEFDPNIFYKRDYTWKILRDSIGNDQMGTGTLFKAYQRYYGKNKKISTSWLLEERYNQNEPGFSVYNELLRKENGGLCNFIVHDPITNIPYFYSRVVGVKFCRK